MDRDATPGILNFCLANDRGDNDVGRRMDEYYEKKNEKKYKEGSSSNEAVFEFENTVYLKKNYPDFKTLKDMVKGDVIEFQTTPDAAFEPLTRDTFGRFYQIGSKVRKMD